MNMRVFMTTVESVIRKNNDYIAAVILYIYPVLTTLL